MSIRVANGMEKDALLRYLDHIYMDLASIKELYDMDKDDLDYLDEVKADVDTIVDRIEVDETTSNVIKDIVYLVAQGYSDNEIVVALDGTVGRQTVERVRKMRRK